MADKNDGGSKTEKPTPKRIKDARKKGDVPKSKDMASLFMMFYWLALLWLASSYIGEQFVFLTDSVLSLETHSFHHSLHELGWLATKTLLLISFIVLVPAVMMGLTVNFLQIGPVFTLEKVKPKLENLNPVEGVKRMFSWDNLIEVLKSIVKTSVIFLIAWLVYRSLSAEIITLLRAPTEMMGEALWQVGVKLCLWATLAFTFVSILDHAYQKYSFEKKMRMSIRDIKQEFKDTDGDPLIKQQRHQLHHEWSQDSAVQAAGNANVLLVNPTHLAIAIKYDKESQPIPIMSAKGSDDLAREMRKKAEENEIPVLRNIDVARALYRDMEDGDAIPKQFFDIIAEVLIWAREVKTLIDKQKRGLVTHKTVENYKPPGEDLTNYPLSG